MQLYILTSDEVTLINSMQGLIVCDYGLGYIGVDPAALQGSAPHLTALGGYDAERVVEFDLVDHEVAHQLKARKKHRIKQVDVRTATLVTAGLEVAEGKVLSTSFVAHQNLQDIAILVLLGQDPFPQGVSCVDGDEYVMTDLADFTRIVGLLQTSKLGKLNAGRQLRKAIIAASDETVLDQIQDTRS